MVPANVLQILRDGTAKFLLVSYVCMNIYHLSEDAHNTIYCRGYISRSKVSIM